MKDKTLLNVAIISSLIGILLILFIADKTSIPNSNIINITESLIGEKMNVAGKITSLKELPGVYLINLRDDTGEIPVIVSTTEKITLVKDQIIEVEGIVTKYKGKLEINADLIKVNNA